MTSQTPKEILDSLHRLVPMQVAKAASVIEDDYMRALRDVRMYARQLDHVPDDIAEENDQTHKNDKDIAFKRVLYRQAGLFKLRREFLDNKTRLEKLKDEQKAAKKLREKFKLSGEISQLEKRQKLLSQVLADPNGYVNRLRQASFNAQQAVKAARAELKLMEKEAGEGKKKPGFMDRIRLEGKRAELAQLEKQADSLGGIDIDLQSEQFKLRVKMEAQSMRNERQTKRTTRANLGKYIAEAEAILSPKHKVLEAVWRMERYGYGDIPVPLIKKKDPAVVAEAVLGAEGKAEYTDNHPMATPEDLLVRFDASYRQAEIAADIAPALLDEIENDMRILQKELKKTKLGKKLLKEDVEKTKKDFSFRHERRTGGLIDMIRDIFTKARDKVNDTRKNNDRKPKP